MKGSIFILQLTLDCILQGSNFYFFGHELEGQYPYEEEEEEEEEGHCEGSTCKALPFFFSPLDLSFWQTTQKRATKKAAASGRSRQYSRMMGAVARQPLERERERTHLLQR